MTLVVLTSPGSEIELMTAVGLLRAYGIAHYVRGGGFGSLNPGPRIEGYNGTAIMVPAESLEEARALLSAEPSAADVAPLSEPREPP